MPAPARQRDETPLAPVVPLFTPQQITEDGQNRIARTVGQVTMPNAVIGVVDYLLQTYLHRQALPPVVVLDLSVIGTGLAAWLTNRKKLRGEAGQSIIGVVLIVLLILILLGYFGRR